MFLDGNRKKIFDTKGHYIASTLIHNNAGLQFISVPWDNYPSNLPETTEFSLITIGNNGNIESEEKIPPFTTGYNGYLTKVLLNDFNLVNITRWTEEDLCLGIRKIKMPDYDALRSGIQVDSPRPFLPNIIKILSNNRGILFNTFTDFRRFKEDDINSLIKDGGINFSRLYYLKTTEI